MSLRVSGKFERRRLLVAAGALMAVPFVPKARATERVYRVGYLTTGSSGPGPTGSVRSAFVEGLRERGYVVGRNLVIEWRGAQGHRERLPLLASELARAGLDVIVSTSDATNGVLKKATSTVPVVMLISQDPIARGLVASLARPGGNITGLSTVLLHLVAKELELLREAVPAATRLAYLRDDTGELPGNVVAAALRQEVAATRATGFEIHQFPVRDAVDLEPAFRAIARERMDALQIAFTPFTFRHRVRIAQLALRGRIPALAGSRPFAEAGALLSYGVDMRAAWRRGAYYVDRILKGTKPADLPIEQPTKFDLVVNMKTANAIGITLPLPLLLRVNRVIE